MPGPLTRLGKGKPRLGMAQQPAEGNMEKKKKEQKERKTIKNSENQKVAKIIYVNADHAMWNSQC